MHFVRCDAFLVLLSMPEAHVAALSPLVDTTACLHAVLSSQADVCASDIRDDATEPAGMQGEDPEIRRALQPLLERYDVAAYLCGHEHNLQHLHADGETTHYIVSGARCLPACCCFLLLWRHAGWQAG